MNNGIVGNTDDLWTKRFYHGTLAELRPRDLSEPSNSQDVVIGDTMTTSGVVRENLVEIQLRDSRGVMI